MKISSADFFNQIYVLTYETQLIRQGWIKCGSREQRSQEMAGKIEEIITLMWLKYEEE